MDDSRRRDVESEPCAKPPSSSRPSSPPLSRWPCGSAKRFAEPGLLALGLALAAVAIAVFGVYKARLLEFAPEVLAGDVIVPRPSRAGADLKLLLPLQFSNSGSADGVIEWVALGSRSTATSSARCCSRPVAEVDMQRFIQAKRRLDSDNCIEPFTAFALEGKRSIAKFVLFDLAESARGRARAPARAATPSSSS